MLKIEQQVCSLELAKKLKKLNCKQDSLFYWFKDCQEAHNGLKELDLPYLNTEATNPPDTKVASAFTVAELLDILPNSILFESKLSLHTGSSLYGLEIHKTNKDGSYKITKNAEYSVQYKNPIGEILNYTTDKNLANALAKILCFLIENNLITLNK